MKTKLLYLILFLAALTLTSCKQSSDDDDIIAAPSQGSSPTIELPSDSVLDPDEDLGIVESISDDIEEKFIYDKTSNECIDTDGATGQNSAIGECGKIENARIYDTNYSEANLSGIFISDSQIEDSSFFNTTLDGAKFSNVTLSNVQFKPSSLEGAQFDETIINNSDLRDFETLEALIDSGLKLGDENQLPKLVAELEEILSDNFVIDGDQETTLDPISEKEIRRIASESKASDEVTNLQQLKDQAKAIQQEIAMVNEKKLQQRKLIKTTKIQVIGFKEKRNELRSRIKSIKFELKKNHVDLRELILSKRELNKNFRAIKKNYVDEKNPATKKQLKAQLKQMNKQKKEIGNSISEIRKKKKFFITNIKDIKKDIAVLIDSVKDQKSTIASYRIKRKEFSIELKEKVKELRKIRFQIKQIKQQA